MKHTCDCGEVVQVILYGFGGPLYYDKGTPEERQAGFVHTENSAMPIRKSLVRLGLSAVLPFGGKIFARRAAELLFSLMGHLRMDEEGRSIEPLSDHWRIDEAQDHKSRPQYCFDYDWRMDPFEAAAQLNDFIEALCKHTGHGKITLIGFSEGSAVAMAYIKAYGTARLETLILANGAWQGLTFVGELLTRNIRMRGTSAAHFLASLPSKSRLWRPAMTCLRYTCLLEFLRPLGWCIMKFMGNAIYEQALIPLFCHMPAFWAFVPQEYYAEARKLIAGQSKYDKMLEKADKYHYEVQLKAKNLLRRAQTDGVKIAVICGYGQSSIPLTKAKDYHTDLLIDTARASGGATVARYGKKLPKSDSPYLSQDRSIDASTCLFPDSTWFVKGLKHEDGPIREWMQWVIYSEKQPTVQEDKKWKQFMSVQ